MSKEKFPTLPTEGPFVVESFKAAGLTAVSAAEAKRLLKQRPARAESREEFEDLIERERVKLETFFGKRIDVPPLPNSITPEQVEHWKELNFELHYIPEEEMTENKSFPGWIKKPTDGLNLFKIVKDKKNKMAPDTLKLKAGWVLVDNREKPPNTENSQYPDDVLVAVIQNLRSRGVIQGDNQYGDRFRISWEELHSDEVRQAFAEVLEVPVESIRLPRAIEWNFIGNAHNPQWGTTNTYEWFEDSYQGSEHLVGGDSGSGGLSRVGWDPPGERDDNLGFRPLISFS